MSLEAATYVSDLVGTNPTATDPKAQGDDHLRLIKLAAQASFPNASRAFYIPTSVAEQTAAVTVAAANQGKVYPVSASAASRTVNLPANAGIPDGFEVTVFKTDSSANTVTIDPNSSDTINGASTYVLTKQYQGVKCIWLTTFATWLAFPFISAIPYFSGGQDIAFTDIAPSANAKRILAATTATDWSEHTITAILEFVSASLARGDLLMRGASAFDRFAPGTTGYILKSAGAAADLAWDDVVNILPARGYAESTSTSSFSGNIPTDGTVPQNTEGTEFLTATITPRRNTSRIRIHFSALGTAVANYIIAALFRDSVADALYATAVDYEDQNTYLPITFTMEDTPATVSEITYKIRVGTNTGSGSLNPLFGAAAKTTLTLQEIYV